MELEKRDNTGEVTDISNQLCGFKIGEGHYAVPVLEVQEVIKPQKLTPVPLSEPYVRGLINLRGQIVTSISLRGLFGLEGEDSEDHMNIIVKDGESLFALVVDEILDVMDVRENQFEETPDTLDEHLKQFISGVYKLKENLLISLDLKKIISLSYEKNHSS